MSRIESFKRALAEKRAVKIIAGIDNFDVESVKKVVNSASNSGASAIDICANPDIIAMARSMTELPLFVSSIETTCLDGAYGLFHARYGRFPHRGSPLHVCLCLCYS